MKWIKNTEAVPNMNHINIYVNYLFMCIDLRVMINDTLAKQIKNPAKVPSKAY